MGDSPMNLLFRPVIGAPGAVGLLLLRVTAGAAFMMHGWGKIQQPFGWMPPDAPVPGVLQALAALSEFGGGLAWILGALTPIASLGILGTMTVAALFHISNGDPFVGHGGPSWELAAVYWTVAVLMITVGPGAYSVDAKLFARRPA